MSNRGHQRVKAQKRAKKEHIIYRNPAECEHRSGANCDCSSVWLDDERLNLNITTENGILLIASLGLWNGRRVGYKVLPANVNAILSPSALQDYNKVYSDGHNVRTEAIHHDGKNFYLFRELLGRPNEQKFLNSIEEGVYPDDRKISYYTRSIHPYVANVYGW